MSFDTFFPKEIDTTLRCHVNMACHPACECREAKVKRLIDAAKKIQIIIDNSRGVDGWHLNGDIATWDEFEEREEFDDAIEGLKG